MHIVIINLRFLQHPQKRSRGIQLIHWRLSKTKSTGSGSDPGSHSIKLTTKVRLMKAQAGRQTVYVGWCLELRWGGR